MKELVFFLMLPRKIFRLATALYFEEITNILAVRLIEGLHVLLQTPYKP